MNGHLAALWKSISIFQSSTFADMHAERDFLRRVFRELEERLRDRYHFLCPVDLRQGVERFEETDEVKRERAERGLNLEIINLRWAEDSQVDDEVKRELKVLKVCLDEIERSKPFFLGILGDRYGWVPPAERMESAARAAGFTADLAGKSVTELEILYGVLENPDQLKRSWFYLREMDYTGMPEHIRARFDDRHATDSEANDRVWKLLDLRERLWREVPGRVRTYHARWDAEKQAVSGLEGLAEMVLADLWSDLDDATREWQREAPATWQEANRRQIEDFVVGRTRGYVERPAVTESLIAHALGTPRTDPSAPWGICLTGESGSGKSSIFGRVYQELSGRDDVLVLANAAGIYPRSESVDTMLRRWVHELAGFLQIEDPLAEPNAEASMPQGYSSLEESGSRGTSSEEVEKTFASLLGRASQQRRVVVLIDALNQFERSTRAQYLTWLPKLWPEKARFIATAIPGVESESLAGKTGVEICSLAPIEPEEAWQIADHFYRQRHHREPNSKALAVLLQKQRGDGSYSCANPLWLELALQEMNLLEADDYARAEQQFGHLPGAERMEALQVSEAEMLPPDAAGVYGELLDRAERDFGLEWTRALVNVIAVSRAGWRESDLRVFVPMVCGLPWDELTFAGVRRALGSHLVQRGGQTQWDFFHGQLREAVLKRNLYGLEQQRHLHGLVADHLQGLSEHDPLRVGETMVHLIGHGDRSRAARYLGSFCPGDAVLLAAVRVLAQHVSVEPSAVEFVVSVLSTEGLSDAESSRLAHNLQFEGHDALKVETGLGPRLKLLGACRQTLERLAQNDPSNADWQRDLSVSNSQIGDVLLDQGNLGEALVAYRQTLAVSVRLAHSDPTNAGWQRDLGVSYDRTGDVLLAGGNLGEALLAYGQALVVRESLAQIDPTNAEWQRDLSVSRDKIGDALRAQGNLGEALIAYRQTLALAERLAQSDPSNASWQRDLSVSNLKIGNVLRAQGNLGGALLAYRQALAVAERLAQSDPTNAGWQRNLGVSYDRIGDVLLAQGNLGEALLAYRQALAVAECLTQGDLTNTEWQRDLSVSQGKIGDVQIAQGNLGEALGAYRQALAVLERLAQNDPTNAGWQRDLSVSLASIGDVLRAQGNLGEALVANRESLAVLERLAQSDPTNASWQRDLSVSYDRTGDVLFAQGNLGEALAAYCQGLAIAKRLTQSDPTNTEWRRDLSVSQEKIGDVLLAQGNLGEALAAYRQALAVSERLAQIDPTNAGWRRDLSVSRNRIGDVLRAQGNLAEALAVYRQSSLLEERLAESDPTNAGWQRDLSFIKLKIGDVLFAQGNLGEALVAYRQSLAVFEHLSQSDQTNAGWLRDVAASHCFVGIVLQEQGNLGEALVAYGNYRASMERLAQSDPTNAGWQRDVAASCCSLGTVLQEQGNLDEAMVAYRECLAIVERLAQSDPSNAGWQRDLSVSQEKIGDVLRAQGNLGEALAAYRQSLAIVEHLAQIDPTNAGWQRDLAVSQYNHFQLAQQAGQADLVQSHRAKCHQVLKSMRDRGMYLDTPLESLLSSLEQN